MESDQSALFYKTWAWFEAHKKQVLWGLLLAVLVAFGVGTFAYWRAQRQIDASEALSKLMSRGLGQAAEEAPEAYAKLAEEFPGTAAAARALLLAGGKFFTSSNYVAAQAQFDAFLKEYAESSPFTGQAMIGLAASLDAQGKTNDAIAAYRKLIDRLPNDEVVPQAKLALGRLLEAQGNLSQARDQYQQVARTDFGIIGSEAGMRLRELTAKHPELTAPPVTPTNPPAGAVAP